MWFRKNKDKLDTPQPQPQNLWREYGEMVVEVLIFVFFINTFLLQSEAIPTPSMEKTMLIGDHLLVNKVAVSPKLGSLDSLLLPQVDIHRGMIVTFKGPTEMEKDYVKRAIALPGDTLRIENKKVYINGNPIDEPYIYLKGGFHLQPGDFFPMERPRIINEQGEITYLPFYVNDPAGHLDRKRTTALCEKFNPCVVKDENGKRVFKVPEGHIFCMGDNRDNSYDSRFWGPVPREYINGIPWRVYWSYESTTDEYLTQGLWHKVKDIFLTALRFFTRTRWERTFLKFQ